jgi:membrane protein YdbS with pleckstrin-like domain
MNCPKCSIEVLSDAQFCHHCGASLESPGKDDDAARAEDERDDVPSSGRSATIARKLKRSDFSRAADDDDDVEVELWEGTYSPKAMLTAWIGAALLTLVALVTTAAAGPAAWLWVLALVVVAWMLLGLRLLYMRLNYQYRLTSQRFIHKTGILRRVTNRVEVIDIDDVEYSQGLVDRFVGVGTLRIDSSDRSHEQLVVAGIENVKQVATLIYGARRRERVKRGLHIEAV